MEFTNDQVLRSIERGRLALSPGDALSYWFSGIVTYGLWAALALTAIFEEFSTRLNIGAVGLALATVGVAFFLPASFIKYKSLRLERIDTSYASEAVRELLASLGDGMGWRVVKDRESVMIFLTGPEKSGSSDGWGERITVIIKDGIWAASIIDTERYVSWRSLRRNKENIGAIRAVLAGQWSPVKDAS